MNRLALGWPVVLVVAACGGSLFQSKATVPTVYLLSAASATAVGTAETAPDVAAAAPIPMMAVDLAILKPRVRAGLDTDRIAALYPDRHLDYFAGARWSAPLDEVMQDLAVQSFQARARLRNVGADTSAFASSYWLEIDVADFQAEYERGAAAPTVHVHLLGRVGSAGERRVLGRFEASARQVPAENRLTAIVEAYEKAADAALADIVADTTALLDPGLEHR